MELYKIVITGGPCAGKTTALSWIQNTFSKKGYTVLFVPETATELISNGVAPWTCGTNFLYQECQVDLQLQKERIFEQAARTMPAEKLLLICDRGVADNSVYMTAEEYHKILEKFGLNETSARDQYDAVFHLVTAAKGAEHAYTLANNGARTETVEQAAEMDDRFIQAWTGHPNLQIIDNSTDFTDKMRRLMEEIAYFLGEASPFKKRRKFLIEYPDKAWLESLPNSERIDILQTYLKCTPEEEIRVRQRGTEGSYIYYLTRRRRNEDGTYNKTERRLSQGQYFSFVMSADHTLRQIHKTRYCLSYHSLYFEVDLYPFWDKQAMVEVEYSGDADVSLPEQFKVLREVTNDPEYQNAALAKL